MKKGLFGMLKSFVEVETESDKQDKLQRDFAQEQRQQEQGKPPKESNETWDTEITEEMLTQIQEQLEEILHLSGFGGTVLLSKSGANAVRLEINDAEDTGRIIGREGATLNALQVLLKASFFRTNKRPIKLMIDIGGYQDKRIEQAKEKANRAVEKLTSTQNKRELDPMNSIERRAVHLLFENNETIHSYSVGSGQDRHVVIERRENAA